MNPGKRLLNNEFIIGYLRKKVLPLYPDFLSVSNVDIKVYKDHIWVGNTYHLVIEYRTTFVRLDGTSETLPIFCTAHSSEPRKNVYDSLKFLWDHNFSQRDLTIPRPLIYDEEFRGTFYRGVEGRNLYQYIREGRREVVVAMLPKAAAWFAKLHAIPQSEARNFNHDNSRIATVYPGVSHILKRISERYPAYSECYRQAYGILIRNEEDYLAGTDKRWLVHGDAHPENVIRMGERKLAVIDFTDLCLSDFTRDIGSFLQQLEFMIMRKLGDRQFADQASRLFRNNYFSLSKETFDAGIEKRIKNYYLWTAMRTATHFLLKDKPEPERAYPLIDKVCGELGI